MSREVSRCYDDVNICLWTNGSLMTQSAAQSACQQRTNSFLPRITNSNIQATLAEFRLAAWNLLSTSGILIDVRATVLHNFHWIDDSPLAGQLVPLCTRPSTLSCFAMMALSDEQQYVNNNDNNKTIYNAHIVKHKA